MAATALECARALQPGQWGRIGLALGMVVVVVTLSRALLRMNRMVLATAIFVALSTLCLTWLEQRTEPRALTPLFDRLSQFIVDSAQYARRPEVPGTRP